MRYASLGGDPGRDPRASIAQELLVHGPLLRADLGDRVSLSLPSLTRLTRPLLDAGLVRELSSTLAGATGRPARPLDVVPESHSFVGVKVTGDAAIAVLTDFRAQPRHQLETRLTALDPPAVAVTIARLVAEVSGSDPITAVGVAVGGTTESSVFVRWAPHLGWSDVALADLLEPLVGVPVFVENDVVALTLGEQWFGAGRGHADFAVVTIGAGVGYGHVANDRVITNADSGLGVHLQLESNGPRCGFGHSGCATGLLSIPSILATVAASTGETHGYDEILDRALAGDRVAAPVIEASARALGRLIGLVADLGTVSRVLVGGEGTRLLADHRPLVDEGVSAGRHPDAVTVVLETLDPSFRAWARGGAAVAICSTLDRLATT